MKGQATDPARRRNSKLFCRGVDGEGILEPFSRSRKPL